LILREFLENALQIPALESTTQEIMHLLPKNKWNDKTTALLKDLLQKTDMFTQPSTN
jgi:hypothetical protein